MRHAKSDWSSEAESDFDRPLNARGKAAVEAVADWLFKLPDAPQLILSSPARRARMTAEAMGHALGREVDFRMEIYGADQQVLLDMLRGLDESSHSVLLVGHNPAISWLAAALGGDAGIELRTADIATFRLAGRWNETRPENCKLIALSRAREISPG